MYKQTLDLAIIYITVVIIIIITETFWVVDYTK